MCGHDTAAVLCFRKNGIIRQQLCPHQYQCLWTDQACALMKPSQPHTGIYTPLLPCPALLQHLDSVVFRDVWKAVALAVNYALFNEIATEALFSVQVTAPPLLWLSNVLLLAL